MEKIGSYGYQSSIYGQSKAAASTSRTADTKKTEAVKSNDSKIELSSAAKELLKELHNTYGNTDFMIANYETE